MKRFTFFVFFCLIFFNIYAINSKLFYDNFIQNILEDPYSVENYLADSGNQNNLGINYEIDYPKFLIGNILSIQIRKYLLENQDKFQLVISELTDEFSLLEMNSEYGRMDFYFKDQELISRADYATLNWQSLDSKYFIFKYPASNPPNPIAVQELDDFAATVLELLNFSELQIQLLTNEKIIYLLCPDEAKIEAVTSFKARGICLLNQDYVVSKFPAHFHEVTHMLMNFRIKENQLFTHPFLQEGFAVAMGGRGGKNVGIILDIGMFLQHSGFANYVTLLSPEGFKQMDASLSYPVAGLYSRFLIQTRGIDAYLKLYKSYSNSDGNFLPIPAEELPSQATWEKFLNQTDYSTIHPICDETNFQPLLDSDSLKIRKSKTYFEFQAVSSLRFDYNLGKFQVNDSGRYKLTCNEFEVNLLDTATANLISTYVSGFTLNNVSITRVDGLYKFYLNRELFE